MLFVLLACVATSPLMAADLAGPYAALQASINGVELDGQEETKDNGVTTGTIGKIAVIGGGEIGYVFPMSDGLLLDFGISKNFGDAKISSASTADGRTHANSTAVSFEVSDYMTAYIAPTITLNENSSLYFKIGLARADTKVVGDVSEPDNLLGEVYAIGTRSVMPGGVFIRTEAGFADFDKIEVRGKGSTNGIEVDNTVTATPRLAFGSVSLGYKF